MASFRVYSGKAIMSGLVVAVLVLAGCGESDKPLPEVKAEDVVKKFYEYISEAKIRGGHLLIREAYKLTSSKESRLSQARFIEIINKYPSGFMADVLGAAVKGRHADVTIEYKVASMFGAAHTVRTDIPLNIDEETNTWRIDFTGETDGQDLATLRKAEKAENPPQAEKTAAGGE